MGDTTMEVYELISTDPELVNELNHELTVLRQQLTAAQAERDRYRAALEPFAKTWREWPDDMRWVDWLTTNGNGGALDFKRASEALAQIARQALGGDVANEADKEDSQP